MTGNNIISFPKTILLYNPQKILESFTLGELFKSRERIKNTILNYLKEEEEVSVSNIQSHLKSTLGIHVDYFELVDLLKEMEKEGLLRLS